MNKRGNATRIYKGVEKMVQIMEGTINLNHLQLENQEVEMLVECWNPEVLYQVALKKDMSRYYLQSVNHNTEFVTNRGEEGKFDVISFEELKGNYIPLFTGEKLREIIASLPTECFGLKEKLLHSI